MLLFRIGLLVALASLFACLKSDSTATVKTVATSAPATDPLAEAEKALAGAEDPWVLASHPGRALELAKSAVSGSQSGSEHHLRAIQMLARAQAASGDLTAAAATALQAVKEASVQTSETSYLATAFAGWSKLRHAVPTGQVGPFWTRELDGKTGRPLQLDPSVKLSGTSRLETTFRENFFLAMREGVRSVKKQVLPLSLPNCTKGAPCAADLRRAARQLIAQGDREQAARMLEKAVTVAEQSGDSIALGEALMRRADALVAPNSEPWLLNLALFANTDSLSLDGADPPNNEVISLSEIARAKELYAAAEGRFGSTACPRCLIELRGRRAYLTYLDDKPEVALREFGAIADEFVRLGDYAGAERARVAALGSAMAARLYPDADALVEGFARASDRYPGAAFAAYKIVALQSQRLLATRHDLEAALRAPNQGERLARALGAPDLAFEQKRALATVLHDTGRFRQSLAMRRQLQEQIPESMDDKLRQVAEFEQQISIVSDLVSLNEYAEAKRVQESMNKAMAVNFGVPAESMAEQSAMLLVGTGDYEAALSAARSAKSKLFEAVALLRLGHLAEAKRIFRQELIRVTERIEKGVEDKSIQARTSAQASRIELEVLISAAIGAGEEAFVEQIWTRAERAMGREFLFGSASAPWERPAALAQLAAGTNRIKEAETLFEQAWQLTDRYTSALGGAEDQDGLIGQTSYLLRAHVSLLFKQGKHADALALLDYNQARSLRARLLQSAGRIEADSPSASGQALRSWWEMEADLETLRRKLAGARAPQDIQTLETGIAALQEKRDELARGIDGLPRSPKRMSGSELLKLVSTALSQTPERRLLVCFQGTQQAFLWLVDATGIREARTVPIRHSEIGDLARELRGALAQRGASYGKPAARLSSLLLKPLRALGGAADEKGQSTALGLVTFGSTRKIPFQVLPIEHGGASVPLIARYDLFYVPSLSVYAHLARGRESTETSVAAFGFDVQPLTKAASEAAAVASDRGRAFVGPEATLNAYRAHAPQAGIIHVSSHGEFSRSNPYESMIMLADGPLTPAAVLATPIQARAVVLSACDSGVVETTAAGDFIGLSPAFLAAGAGSVVAAAWQLEEVSAATFMVRLHESLRKGEPVTEAYAHVVRAAIRDGSVSPHDWAALEVNGSGL